MRSSTSSSDRASADWRRFFLFASGTAAAAAALLYLFIATVDPFDVLPLSPTLARAPVSTNARFSFPALARSATAAAASMEDVAVRLARGEGTAGKLLTDETLFARLNATAVRLDDLTGRLQAGQGTAGMLLHDRQLYENMSNAVTELRGLVSDIRKDPKKYLNVKVSLF